MKNIHQLHTQAQPPREQWVDVTVDVDLNRGVVRLTEFQGDVHEFITDNIRAVAAAAANRGWAQWCAKYRQLLIPGAAHGSGGGPFYKLTPASVAATA